MTEPNTPAPPDRGSDRVPPIEPKYETLKLSEPSDPRDYFGDGRGDGDTLLGVEDR